MTFIHENFLIFMGYVRIIPQEKAFMGRGLAKLL